ncbi:MAG: TIGR01777 family oxidoreductase [Verrucomicrobiae bacterium]|nr:TIGR01777 family oxidoreductase [Verrucomicrobiae bacterium]
MKSQKIVLAGGSGFLGRTLAAWFAEKGFECVVLSRFKNSCPHARIITWDGKTCAPWKHEIEGAKAVINLAGRSVNCRYHARNRQLIMDSRIDSTRVIGEAIRACTEPPEIWLNSSTATIYRHTFGAPHDENGEIGATPEAKDAFSIEVAKAWEETFQNQDVSTNTRKMLLRTAMVMGKQSGGVFPVLKRLTRLGLGGRMSHGRQFVSWIHAADFCSAIAWLIENPEPAGIFNLAAPNPLPNAEMMRILREETGTSFGFPAPAWLLEIGAFFLRTETELVIKSRRVIPARLHANGFDFQFPDFRSAVRDLLHHQPTVDL